MTRLIATAALVTFMAGPALAMDVNVGLPDFSFPTAEKAEKPQQEKRKSAKCTQQVNTAPRCQ